MAKPDYSNRTVAQLEDDLDRKLENIVKGIKYDSDQLGKYETEAAAMVRAMVERACKETAAPLLKKLGQLEESQARLEYAFGLLQLRQSLETPDEHNPSESTTIS